MHLSDAADASRLREMMAGVTGVLSSVHIPDVWLRVHPSLPLTSNGKVDAGALVAMAKAVLQAWGEGGIDRFRFRSKICSCSF